MRASSVVVTGLGTAVAGVRAAGDLLGGRPPEPADDDPVTRLKGRGLRYRDRATKLAMCAGGDALRDAGLLPGSRVGAPAAQVGVVTSTNLGNVDTVCDTVTTIAKETYSGTSPMLLPATASNVVASWLAISFGLRGANLTLCNGDTSGLDAVHWGRRLVEAGRVRWVLVVGVEPVNPPVAHLLRDSVVAGDTRLLDGAAALVVESARSAAERGVPALAEVGPYARRATFAQAVAAVRPADRPGSPREVGLWCRPGRALPEIPAELEAADTCDLTAALGRCSGALGVLQTVAGTAWFGGSGSGSVLATSGTGAPDGDDAAAALLLLPGDRDR